MVTYFCYQLQAPEGALDCWVFLTCLEVTKTCSKDKNQHPDEVYSRHMAVLWDYARKKVTHLLGLVF